VNLIEGERRGYTPVDDLALMIDQSHNVKDPLEELIESVDNIETAYAKALLVDFDRLWAAQDLHDPVLADRMLISAYNADVRPVLRGARYRNGAPEDPLNA
jgi:L-rhamnose isomerase/sugar isomerase